MFMNFVLWKRHPDCFGSLQSWNLEDFSEMLFHIDYIVTFQYYITEYNVALKEIIYRYKWYVPTVTSDI